MSELLLLPSPTRRRLRLPSGPAFYLQASIVVFFLAGSSAPTPLYALYQREWGFSSITTTIVFAVYALAVLIALLTVGSLSDYIGRRPVLFTAVVVQALTMLAFATASSVDELLWIRVIQGLSTGAAVAAVGAGMLDIDRSRGTIANSVSAPIGTAIGAIGSGLLVQFLPAPTHLVYLVLSGVFAVQAVGVALMPETSSRQPGALASLRVSFGLPAIVRVPLLVAAPALVAAWALAGFYGALGPSIVKRMIGHNSFVLGGAALFALAATGAVTLMLLRNAAPRTVMLLGTTGLILGVGVTVLALDAASIWLFFAGTVVAGAGFGAAFQGAVRSIVPLARPHERAGVLSIVYVISYLAMGVPAVVGGFLVVHGGGLLVTAREYGVAVMVLAASALAGLLLRSAPAAVTSVCPAQA
ncbi:Predicted arabinose efflux permease, MFS family [Nakamurella panacisegetis]|uniref:Predicted arabinose efflux permease, MFS family n=1 Tax=Nakamurella panacisegetis TaxID=1090615 RepID=A0A1H0L354_9ACTN|nr:MFS transporter [Nakamurella panacisegetis]SDO62714.1 Predicted arabinose efflux permease, MFS family [Nakamurella panacisegetis]